eukprot:TRINITY_DN15052_c0_g1_i1.p1 TRINITY_DN15052_c0_g1~~TRINITY_DN15052_c0_g1_i1.p1  ORF type:complete len:356 (+),score=47.28 TRINITY_DN15052_c0_g1_i1:63-1070(+)
MNKSNGINSELIPETFTQRHNKKQCRDWFDFLSELFKMRKIKKRYRRKRTEMARGFRCSVQGCSKIYGSEGALKYHCKRKHPTVPYISPKSKREESELNTFAIPAPVLDRKSTDVELYTPRSSSVSRKNVPITPILKDGVRSVEQNVRELPNININTNPIGNYFYDSSQQFKALTSTEEQCNKPAYNHYFEVGPSKNSIFQNNAAEFSFEDYNIPFPSFNEHSLMIQSADNTILPLFYAQTPSRVGTKRKFQFNEDPMFAQFAEDVMPGVSKRRRMAVRIPEFNYPGKLSPEPELFPSCLNGLPPFAKKASAGYPESYDKRPSHIYGTLPEVFNV